MPILRVGSGISALNAAIRSLFSSLTVATSIADADLVLIEQAGINSRTASVGQLRSGMAAANHGHAIADTASLQVAIDGKQPLSSSLSAIGSGTSGVGTADPAVPRNADLGTAAFLDWWLLPACWRAELVAANRALTGDDHGKAMILTSALTVTLPIALDPLLQPTWSVRIKNRSGGAITLQCANSVTLNGGAPGGSISLVDTTSVTLVRVSGIAFESL